MKFNIVHSLNEEEWRAFVDHHPCSNVFHTPEMFQVFARAKGHKPTFWAIVDNNHHPLALILPVQITLKNGLFYRWTTRAVAYGSVLSASGPEGSEALKLLLLTYKRKMQGNFLFTELRNLSDLSELHTVMSESNFSFEDHLNFIIDLDQSEEVLWKSISKSGRQSIRSATNKGTTVEETTDRRQLVVAYHLLQKVYSRVHVPLADISLFEAAYDILVPRGMLKIFLAHVGDDYIGACFILLHKGRMIDWYAGIDRDFSTYCAGELLIWRILQWGKEHNFHMFDFGGGGRPDEKYGPRDFKSKFGGNTVLFGRYICIHSPFSLQVSRQVYSRMQKVLLLRSPNPGQKHNVEKS